MASLRLTPFRGLRALRWQVAHSAIILSGLMFIALFVFADMMYFNFVLASTESASFSIPAANFVAYFRPIFTIEAVCSAQLTFPRMGVKMIGEEDSFDGSRYGLGRCSNPLYSMDVREVIEGFAICCPSEPSISAVVFLVDCSNPQPCFLAQPEFHSLEGIGANVVEGGAAAEWR